MTKKEDKVKKEIIRLNKIMKDLKIAGDYLYSIRDIVSDTPFKNCDNARESVKRVIKETVWPKSNSWKR